MKKIALFAALILAGSLAFAQGQPGPGGQGGPGRGPMADIDWKVGTVVTSEYKKVSGTLVLGTVSSVTFKADGVEYQLLLPRLPELSSLKNGDAITVEGIFTTVKSDTKVAPAVRPFKITVAGKEIDLSQLREERREARDGQGKDGKAGGPQDGPRR